ncbi:MAG: hypothetical protein ACPG44_01640 [Polaribacter sp.]
MITQEMKSSLKYGAKKLTKHERRAYMAKVTASHYQGSIYKAEKDLGWFRATIQLGQKELETGFICLGNYSARGRKKIEQTIPTLEKDVRELVERESQTDPKFQTEKKFCKISAIAVCEMLEQEKGYPQGLLSQQTMNNLLNRLGYSLKKR